jgi:hypothetical protein
MDWTEAHLQGDLEAMQQVREEAIVRAALERAADRVVTRVEKRGPAEYRCGISGYSNGIDACFDAIRSLASDPAEVAAIIKKAGEDWG